MKYMGADGIISDFVERLQNIKPDRFCRPVFCRRLFLMPWSHLAESNRGPSRYE
jgi:hypothetical protein